VCEPGLLNDEFCLPRKQSRVDYALKFKIGAESLEATGEVV
jgi:hypothetical protein